MLKHLTPKDWIAVMTLAVSVGTVYGILSTKVSALETKTQDLPSMAKQVAVIDYKVDLALDLLKGLTRHNKN